MEFKQFFLIEWPTLYIEMLHQVQEFIPLVLRRVWYIEQNSVVTNVDNLCKETSRSIKHALVSLLFQNLFCHVQSFELFYPYYVLWFLQPYCRCPRLCPLMRHLFQLVQIIRVVCLLGVTVSVCVGSENTMMSVHGYQFLFSSTLYNRWAVMRIEREHWILHRQVRVY